VNDSLLVRGIQRDCNPTRNLKRFLFWYRPTLDAFCEITGAAGDVMLGHPFLFHTRGYKRHGAPRILSNSEVPLRAPLALERADGDYSVLERSIRAALTGAPQPRRDDAMSCRF